MISVCRANENQYESFIGPKIDESHHEDPVEPSHDDDIGGFYGRERNTWHSPKASDHYDHKKGMTSHEPKNSSNISDGAFSP